MINRAIAVSTTEYFSVLGKGSTITGLCPCHVSTSAVAYVVVDPLRVMWGKHDD